MKRVLVILGVLISALLGYKFGVPEEKKARFAAKRKGFWKKVGGFLKKNAPKAVEFIKEALL